MFWSAKTGISSKYSFSSSPTFTCEPWNIYMGRSKSSNSASGVALKVSIFVFDKKQFENYLLNYGIIKSRSSSHDRSLLQDAYEVLRRQVSNLSKLKHPNIVAVIEPLEEHSKNFMFVTEYVTGSLESVFGHGNEGTSFFQQHDKEEVIIQRGLLEIVQALDFIHNRASSVDLDIQPRSILINENSDWKICGLGHLIKLPQGTNSTEYFIDQYDPRTPSFLHLQLNYTAPEIVLDNTVSFKSDYFSLGLLIYMLYTGKDMLSTENSTSQYRAEYTKFERKLATMSWENMLNKLPVTLRPCIPRLMNRDIYSRYDNINEFLDSEFFQDPLIKTLSFLDDLPTKTNDEKVVFLNGLEELLPQFPVTLLQRKFLTVLLESLAQQCKDKEPHGPCISKEVEIITRIGSTVSQLTFQEKIYPALTMKSNFPIILHNATMAFIKDLSTLRQKIKKEDFLEIILKPLLTFTFHDMQGEQSLAAQESLLENLNIVADLFDFVTMKNFLMPLISHLFTKTTSLMVKVSSISCLRELIDKELVDSDLICDEVLPLFKSMKTRDPRILMQSLTLFEMVPKVIKNDETLVEQLLPLLWSYSMSQTLDKAQYSRYTVVINKLSQTIQKAHSDTLQDSNPNSHDTAGTKDFDNLIKPVSVKREDPETKAAKSIAVPAIVPKKKPEPKRPSILTARPNQPSKTIPRPRILPPKPRQETDPDDFDDFVSATSSPAPSSTTATTAPSQGPSQRSIPTAKLPPGFSVSLQPSRKPIETTPRSTQTSDSLI
ncbi:hypothetical protein HG537_0A01480 [Torulaspora globosa]|uniref:Protein kinase domain-containing protein n=1 Tax=Torulaspora globosa TaxID=48254 RepID=A0A7H9HL49_9SACH|nr:hypothetical protein HG537_0A01480 [Torulaspora sp. CBS 2947]